MSIPTIDIDNIINHIKQDRNYRLEDKWPLIAFFCKNFKID
jgi:hypothetical protein